MTQSRGNKPTREESQQNFLDYCERVGFGEIEVEVADGVPYLMKRGLQKVRFDIKKNVGDATFDLTDEKK